MPLCFSPSSNRLPLVSTASTRRTTTGSLGGSALANWSCGPSGKSSSVPQIDPISPSATTSSVTATRIALPRLVNPSIADGPYRQYTVEKGPCNATCESHDQLTTQCDRTLFTVSASHT